MGGWKVGLCFYHHVDEVLTVSCNEGHAKVTIASPVRVVTGKLAAIPARRLVSFLLGCITRRGIRHVIIKRPGRVGGRSSRGVGCVGPFITRLGGGLPSVPIRLISRQFASILTRRTVLSNKLGGGTHRSGTLISRVDTAVVLRSCLRSEEVWLGGFLGGVVLPVCMCKRPMLHRRTRSVAPSCPNLGRLVVGVFRAVSHTSKIKLTTPRVKLPVHIMIIGLSILSSSVPRFGSFGHTCVGPRVLRANNRLISVRRNYLDLPNVRRDIGHPSGVRIACLSRGVRPRSR